MEMIKKLQASMVESAGAALTELEREHLRVLVRLAVEFQDFIRQVKLGTVDPQGIRYGAESVFSGLESFCSVDAAYRILVGATSSTLKWKESRPDALTTEVQSLYEAFQRESSFEMKCRLLLDVFKLQIVLAGIMYD